MADRPSIKTQPITRDKLATFLKSHELIKAFERLISDITETLPDSIVDNSAAVEEAQSAAENAGAAAVFAQGVALYVRRLVESIVVGPPQLPASNADLLPRLLAMLPPPPTKGDLGLGNVSNIDLTTWPGSTNLTTLGTVTTGTWNASVVQPLYGGTGLSSYAIGDILYASGVAALSRLAGVATGNALISGGIGVAPSWGKIGLTTHISGTLGVGNGGTGTATTFTQGAVVFAGASGIYSQNSTNLFWDNTNNALGVGTSTPAAFGNTGKFSVQTASSTNGIVATFANSGSTGAGIQLFQNGVATFDLRMPAGAAGLLMVDGGTTRLTCDASGNFGIAATPSGSYKLEVNGALSISSTTLIRSATALTNGAGAAGGTLTNAPAAGNPTKWVPINDAGVTRYIPTW